MLGVYPRKRLSINTWAPEGFEVTLREPCCGGAGVGVFIGTMVKFMIGSLIWFIVAVAAFWP